MPVLTLDCWTCREKITGEANRHPQFAFELAQMADQIGWIGHIDIQHNRALVFCCHSCLAAARTQSGHIRIRRPAAGSHVVAIESIADMPTPTPENPEQ